MRNIFKTRQTPAQPVFRERLDALLGYAVEGWGKRILVDTSPPDKETLDKVCNRQHSDYSTVTDALKRVVGWEPGDVDIVINTHLHFDHCTGNVHFPDAEHYIQRTEVRYAAAPTGSNKPWPIVRDPRFWDLELRPVSDDYPLFEGVTLITLSGHSPGYQGVLLEGGYRAIITGDQLHSFLNWERGMPGVFIQSVKDWYASHEKMKRLKLDLVFPCHDIDVFRQDVYEV